MDLSRLLLLLNMVFLVCASHIYAMRPGSPGWTTMSPCSPRRPAPLLVALEELKKEREAVATPTSEFYSSASASSLSDSSPAASSLRKRRYAVTSLRKMREVVAAEGASSTTSSSGSGAGSSSMHDFFTLPPCNDYPGKGGSASEIRDELKKNRDLLLDFRKAFTDFFTKTPLAPEKLMRQIQGVYKENRKKYNQSLSKAILLGLGCRITPLQDFSLEEKYPLDFKPLDDLGFLQCKECRKFLFDYNGDDVAPLCLCAQEAEGFSDAADLNAQLSEVLSDLRAYNRDLTAYIDCIRGLDKEL